MVTGYTLKISMARAVCEGSIYHNTYTEVWSGCRVAIKFHHALFCGIVTTHILWSYSLNSKDLKITKISLKGLGEWQNCLLFVMCKFKSSIHYVKTWILTVSATEQKQNINALHGRCISCYNASICYFPCMTFQMKRKNDRIPQSPNWNSLVYFPLAQWHAHEFQFSSRFPTISWLVTALAYSIQHKDKFQSAVKFSCYAPLLMHIFTCFHLKKNAVQADIENCTSFSYMITGVKGKMLLGWAHLEPLWCWL